MAKLLHKAGHGTCRFVLDYRPSRLTALGPLHQLPVVCAAPASAGAWCEVHRKNLFEPPRRPVEAPAAPRLAERRQEPATPVDCLTFMEPRL